MSVCCECCVMSGRGLCDGLITCPEESYRVWCVWVCVIVKPRRNEEAQAHIGLSSHCKKKDRQNLRTLMYGLYSSFVDFTLPPRCWWDLCCSGILRSAVS
jgi:hypothetical protein